MTVYVVTGHLGGGKGLYTVKKIMEYLARDKPVYTNIDLFPDKVLSPYNKNAVNRLSDFPTLKELQAIPVVCNPRDKKNFGCPALDEVSYFLGNREWNDAGRKDMVRWFKDARKKGLDVYLIVQDVESMDKSIRNSLTELMVNCSNLGNFMVPVIGRLVKALTGISIQLPQFHHASIRYKGMVRERVWYRASEVANAYDTGQLLGQDPSDESHTYGGCHTILSPWYTRGRYLNPVDWRATLSTIWFRWLPALFGGCELLVRKKVPQKRTKSTVVFQRQTVSDGVMNFRPRS